MKRYFIYIIMVVAALFVGCTTEDVNSIPDMVDAGDIEVTFSVNGEEVSRYGETLGNLDLSSVSHTIVVDVTLNNDGVYWTPVSNKEWCQIVEETHRGSGSFTIVINANDSFDARETATIKFVAGEFEEKMLTVDHNGNVFVIEQVYAVSTKAAGSITTQVKTFDTAEAWSFECDAWITATKGAVTTSAEGETITEFIITWEANADASRYGEVKLIKDGKNYADGWINIWQYGTELTYDAEGADGNILLAAEEPAPLELRVPKQTIKEIGYAVDNNIVMPSWVTYTTQENSDNTVSYMLQFADNPSDAELIRETKLVLSMLSGSHNVNLPRINQSYYAKPNQGLITGPGLALFAKRWNEGGVAAVSQWCVNGVPTITSDIDLIDIEWVSIGTAEHPWTGEFNGNGKKLVNLKSSQPLFGVCKDATIKNIVFDETSKINVGGDYEEICYLAPLAATLENSIVENCTNNATVSFEAKSKSNESSSFVAGLVGKIDATSKISNCTNIGTVNVINSSTTTSSDGNFYVGGLVAYNEGIVEDGFNNGSIEGSAQVTKTYLGGIAGYTESGAIIRNNLNAGAVKYGAARGSNVSLHGYVGGIVGIANGEISGNTNEGDITSTSTVQELYLGGVTGYILDPAIKIENNVQANASDLEVKGKGVYAYVGGLAGYVDEETTVSFDFSKDSGTFAGTINVGKSEAVSSAFTAAGGIIGYSYSPISIANALYNGTITVDITENTTGDHIAVGAIIGWAESGLTLTESTNVGKIDIPKTTSIPKTKMSYGGLVGLVKTNATITGCTNTMNVEFGANTPSKSNGVPCHMGGIVGRIFSGKAVIENCHNKGYITNRFYNNNTFYDLDLGTVGTMNSTGGILGSYGYKVSKTSSDSCLIKDCTNTHPTRTYRACVGGIVGYIRNGEVENCTYLNGRMNDSGFCNSYGGGIVGVCESCTVNNCTATADINSSTGGSGYPRCGGIVAWARKSTISNCSFYGNLTYTANGTYDDFCGGILALAEDDECVVKDSRYGGSVQGVTVSANNCADYAVGVASLGKFESAPTVSNISYWNGK